MGRKTACTSEQWKAITRFGASKLARELRKRKILNDGMRDFDVWRQYFAKYLRTASELAIDECDVDRIVNEALNKALGGGGGAGTTVM